MSKVVYHIVPHGEGWGYRFEGTFSETFPSHDAARAATLKVAREQTVPGADVGISWERADGKWHEELAHGKDRPQTEVDG